MWMSATHVCCVRCADSIYGRLHICIASHIAYVLLKSIIYDVRFTFYRHFWQGIKINIILILSNVFITWLIILSLLHSLIKCSVHATLCYAMNLYKYDKWKWLTDWHFSGIFGFLFFLQHCSIEITVFFVSSWLRLKFFHLFFSTQLKAVDTTVFYAKWKESK